MLLGCSLENKLPISWLDRDAVVLLIRQMLLIPVETEGGSMDTTTLEKELTATWTVP